MNNITTKKSHLKFHLRKLNPEDLSFCDKLVKQAGWNQIERDWARVLTLDHEGCFIVEHEGNRAGTIVFTRFVKVAWISMVLVDKSHRGKGIGQWMFGQVVDILRGLGIETIRLDATDMGVNLYKKYGFQEEYHLIRMVCDDVKASVIDVGLKQVESTDISGVVKLDGHVTGTDRKRLIEHMSRETGTKFYVDVPDGDEAYGYVGMRSGRTGWQIGPCIAKVSESGITLLDRSLKSLAGAKVIIDIPVINQRVLNWARDHNFTEQRRFIRMYSGRKIHDQPDKIFASFGPEKG